MAWRLHYIYLVLVSFAIRSFIGLWLKYTFLVTIEKLAISFFICWYRHLGTDYLRGSGCCSRQSRGLLSVRVLYPCNVLVLLVRALCPRIS